MTATSARARGPRLRRVLGVLGLLLTLAATTTAPASPAPAPPPRPEPGPATSPGPQRTPAQAHHWLELSGNTAGDQWRGTQHIAFTNTGGTPLDRIWLRLWSNGIHGCAATDPIRVTGVTGGTPGPLAQDCTALPVDLPAPLAPGDATEISFHLAIDVPYQHQRFGRVGDFSYLGNAVPVLAVRDAGGWHLPPYVPEGGSFGESFFSLTADFTVTLDHPSALAVPATGTVQSTQSADGRTVTRIHAPRVRDFAFAAGPFREVTAVTRTGVTVRGWATPDVTSAQARSVTATVGGAVDFFSDSYGAYAHGELDAVISGAFTPQGGGMEYPGFVLTEPTGSVAAHETAHQWWYGMAGNDQYHHPWLDESVAQFATDLYLNRRRDCSPVSGWPSASARVDAGMDYFAGNYAEYVPTVYHQGVCMLHDVRATVGAEGLRLALSDLMARNRYGVVEPAEFRQTVQEHSRTDLDPLWQRWRSDRG
ncbi:M1 family metallopeptidase [Streptomyces sp. SS8]